MQAELTDKLKQMETTKQLDLFSNEAQPQGLHICNVSASFDLYVEEIKRLGYSVLIRNRDDHKVIMWSTKAHWASAAYKENSEDDLMCVIKRIKETIVSFSNAR